MQDNLTQTGAPRVFVFNPFAEGYIARGKAFTPVKQQSMLARDLANLPQFLCDPEDVVLTEQQPGPAFLRTLERAGFRTPEFIALKEWTIDCESRLRTRAIAGLRPWAWGPDSVELFAPIFGNVTGARRTPSEYFNDRIAQLYSKAWSAEFLRGVLSRHGPADWLCPEREVGVAVESVEEALEVIASIRSRGQHKLVVKEAIGVAGHNAIRLWEPELLEAQRRWIRRAVAHGRRLVIEPWLERELDFSVQLEMDSGGLKLRGYTGLINDRKGQFQGNWARSGGAMPARVSEWFGTSGKELYAEIFRELEIRLRAAGYIGPVGIDALVYLTAQGERRLKPIVEINPRYTMGRLTLELMRHTCNGIQGLFRFVSRAGARAAGFENFAGYGEHLDPLRLEGGKMRAGAVCLNDPAEAQICLAVFHAGRFPGALEEFAVE